MTEPTEQEGASGAVPPVRRPAEPPVRRPALSPSRAADFKQCPLLYRFRAIDPIDTAVVSVTQFQAGRAMNVIPETAVIRGTCRALRTLVQEQIEARMEQIVTGVCAAHGLTYTIEYDRRYPVLVNTPEETSKAASAAIAVAGEENVNTNLPPTMGSEDFAWMLQDHPGCYIRVGNGEGLDGGGFPAGGPPVQDLGLRLGCDRGGKGKEDGRRGRQSG